MKISLFILLTILNLITASAQNKRSIEFSLIGRYDNHADYTSNFAGRAYYDNNKLYGISYGINAAYRQRIYKNISVLLAIGYYRLGIDKIKGSMPFNMPGTRTARNIDYDDDSTNLLYSTSKYHYNNIAVTIGVNKTMALKERMYFDLGLEGIIYCTVSQRYQLFDGPHYYSTNNSKPLEFGINATAGVLKEYKKFYIRPALIIPIYQRLKGDRVFFEEKNMNISKWFKGVGLTLRIGKYI